MRQKRPYTQRERSHRLFRQFRSRCGFTSGSYTFYVSAMVCERSSRRCAFYSASHDPGLVPAQDVSRMFLGPKENPQESLRVNSKRKIEKDNDYEWMGGWNDAEELKTETDGWYGGAEEFHPLPCIGT